MIWDTKASAALRMRIEKGRKRHTLARSPSSPLFGQDGGQHAEQRDSRCRRPDGSISSGCLT